MLAVAAEALTAFTRPHQVYTRVEVWRAGVRLLSNLPINGGNVRATLQSRTTRTLTIDVPPEYFPESAADLLAPFGTEIRAFRGVAIGGNTMHPSYVWPVFRGPIDKTTWSSRGIVNVSCTDRAGEVANASFEQPITVTRGEMLHAKIRQFISEGIDGAEFDAFTIEDRPLPTLAYDEDRGRALDELAGGSGAHWYALADGRFTLRPVPWVYSTGVPVATLGPAFAIVREVDITFSRDNVHNMFVVRAERSDGSPPSRYVTKVTDPASPIRYGGPFGRRVLHYSAPSAINSAALQPVGETLKQRSQALAETWSATIVPFPPLELGDLLAFDVPGPDANTRRRAKQVVAGFTLPLTGDQDMSLDLRALMPTGEAVGV